MPATGNTKLAGSNSSAVKVFVLGATGRKQTLEGFGGAITDSSAFVYSSLSAEDRAAVVEALYGDSGNRLTLMRVPIGPSDFATSLYSYDENGGAADPDLEHFSVAHDDAYIVPMIRDAMESAARRTDWPQASVDTTSTTTTTTTTATTTTTTDKAREVRVLATPWTAPSWMKRAGAAAQLPEARARAGRRDLRSLRRLRVGLRRRLRRAQRVRVGRDGAERAARGWAVPVHVSVQRLRWHRRGLLPGGLPRPDAPRGAPGAEDLRPRRPEGAGARGRLHGGPRQRHHRGGGEGFFLVLLVLLCGRRGVSTGTATT